ncbi:MAG: hypothetical protein HY336_00460 [Candidatus Doudnabacteria bacterium]|nr:hypothetical protein [Candidatus Doudnabacteria bacterium]
MARFDFKRIVEWLSFVLRCPVCGHKYNPERTRIIDTKDEKPQASASLLIHTDCDSCKSSVVFSIAIDGPEIFSIGMVTDLTSQDTSKFKNKNPINADDVLATHEFLKEFNGDFRELLK